MYFNFARLDFLFWPCQSDQENCADKDEIHGYWSDHDIPFLYINFSNKQIAMDDSDEPVKTYNSV